MIESMGRDAIIARLRDAEAELKARGVVHAALFGSAARLEAGPDSDIDVMVEIDPDEHRRMDVFDYVGIVHVIEDLFPLRVDVSNRIALKDHLRPGVERDAIYAF